MPAEFDSQPGSRLEPLPLSGPNGHTERIRRLGIVEPGKIAALDDARKAWILGSQLFEREIDIEDLGHATSVGLVFSVERHDDLVTSPLDSQPSPGTIDHDLPHRQSADGKEVSAVPPRHLRLVGQPQVSIVNQGGRVERIEALPTPELGAGHASQVVIDQRDETIERRSIALSMGGQQHGDLDRRVALAEPRPKPSRGGWRDPGPNDVFHNRGLIRSPS